MTKASEIKKETKESSLSSPLLLLFLVATLIRGVVLFASLDSFNADPDSYLKLAENWYSYGVFGEQKTPTAFRPPLYPALLKELVSIRVKSERPKVYADQSHASVNGKKKLVAPSEPANESAASEFFDKNVALSRNASIAFLHWVFGVATILLVWLYSRKVGLSSNLALLAGLLVVFDPILLQQSRLIMTETVAAFFSALLLLTTSAVVLNRTSRVSFLSYAFVGALYGLSTLCRPAFYAFAFLVFINLFFIEVATLVKRVRERKESGAEKKRVSCVMGGSFLRLASFLIGAALVVAPWGLRNYREFQRPILTTTHGGYTLYLANNPELYAHYISSSPFSLWDPEPFHARRLKDFDEALKAAGVEKDTKESELLQNEWTHDEALQTIRENRSTFLYSCLIRAGELWRFLPNDVSSFAGDDKPRHEKNIAGMSASQIKEYGRYGVAVFYIVEFILALAGCLSLCRKSSGKTNEKEIRSGGFLENPLIWGFLLVLSVQVPHLFFWTNMRMRAPLEVFIPVIAILSVNAILKRKSSSPQIR